MSKIVRFNRKPHRRRRRSPIRSMIGRRWFPFAALLAVAAGIHLFNSNQSLPTVIYGTGCNIKGNVSVTGERIYHLPSQEYYDATRINPARGERWFCSEEEAREAGWRRARR